MTEEKNEEHAEFVPGQKHYEPGQTTVLVRQIIQVQRRYRQDENILFEPITIHTDNFSASLDNDEPAEAHKEMLETLQKSKDLWNVISGFESAEEVLDSDEFKGAWNPGDEDGEEAAQTDTEEGEEIDG